MKKNIKKWFVMAALLAGSTVSASAQIDVTARISNYANLISYDDDAPNFDLTDLTDVGVLYHLGDNLAEGEERFGEDDPEGFGHADKLNSMTAEQVYDLKPGDNIILLLKSTAEGAQVRAKLNYMGIDKETGDVSTDVTDKLLADGEETVTLKPYGSVETEYVTFTVPAANLLNELIANKIIVTGHDADLLGIFVAPSFETTKADRRDNYLHETVQAYGWNWVYDLKMPQAKEGDHPLVVSGALGVEGEEGFQDGNAYFKWNNTDEDLAGAGGTGGNTVAKEYYDGWITPETVDAFRTGFGFAYTGQISRVGIVCEKEDHEVLDLYFVPEFFKAYDYEEALADALVGDRVAFFGSWSADGTCAVTVTNVAGDVELASGQFPFSLEITAENLDYFKNGDYQVNVTEGDAAGLCLWPNVGELAPTGINNVPSASETVKKGATYDLQGRRVNGQISSGLYIRDGKKYLKK